MGFRERHTITLARCHVGARGVPWGLNLGGQPHGKRVDQRIIVRLDGAHIGAETLKCSLREWKSPSSPIFQMKRAVGTEPRLCHCGEGQRICRRTVKLQSRPKTCLYVDMN